MGLKTIVYLFMLPFFVSLLQTGKIDYVLFIIAVGCSAAGTWFKAAKENEKTPATRSRKFTHLASAILISIFGFSIGEYIGKASDFKVIITMSVSAGIAYMGDDLLEAFKRAGIKFVSMLPEILKSKITNSNDENQQKNLD